MLGDLEDHIEVEDLEGMDDDADDEDEADNVDRHRQHHETNVLIAGWSPIDKELKKGELDSTPISESSSQSGNQLTESVSSR